MNTQVQPPFLSGEKLTLPGGVVVLPPAFPPLRLSRRPVKVHDSNATANDPGELVEVKLTPEQAEKHASVAVAMVQGATDSLTEAGTKAAAIRKDPDLSASGRARKIEPVLLKGIEEIAMIWTACDEADARVDAAEAKLLAVPQLAPGATVAALTEIEMRSWHRAQSAETRAATLQRITSPGASEQDHALLLALLHNPVGIADQETKVLRDKWDNDARNANPDTAAGIELEREALDWARRSLGVLAAAMVNVVGGERVNVLRALLTSDNERAQRGFRAYGFDTDAAARMRRVISAEQKASGEPTPAGNRYVGRLWGQTTPTAA